MSETIRIRTTPNGSDKYLKVKVEQEFDFIEVLSMKITQEDAYRNFCSDYGVIVGRVIVNSGVGLPNARVSVFIPVDDVDKNNPEIKGLYPYSVVSDKDSDGIRYNLLPKSSETNNECFTPVGTFPNKREILDNDELLGVYCKYYKFTTTTNSAGDFMIFGVPLGTYTIHVDADISDIGILSQRPYDLISQGTPLKFFDSPTKYKGGTNLDKLVQIKSTNYAVNVQPFWGDPESCEIGITRADIDMNYNIRPCAIFMGSIFGDQDKNSINKRCRPRKKLGQLCEQIAGEGSIEMLRETIDGGVEQFDVDGGRVIDSDGTWAYQIPMNLDYVVTDEFGNLVPSDDKTKGIPTRTSVRFKIGMDNTGGEGRLRTRAKYLVPHNPNNVSEIDYTFNENTKPSSFRSLYWNKIYSVSNFIPRYQTSDNKKTRAITALKDVDDCVGNKTPMPFNRVNADFNPIFFIICLIIKILAFLIYIINRFLIKLINEIIEFLNAILKRICQFLYNIGGFIDKIPFVKFNQCSLCIGSGCCNCTDILKYVPCVYVQCPFDADPGTGYYAPGCKTDNKGWNRIQEVAGYPPNFYPGDPFGNPDKFGDSAGLANCIAALLAEALGIFQFDFYNDWINGMLYGFLLKYKRKRRKTEKFCEYDCDDFFSQGGVDGNKNNVPDNNCRNNFLYDSCYDGADESHIELKSRGLREGLIKKVDTFLNGKKINEEFFYAASLHDATAKLFATDIICLGSVFDCDWQGIPKVQQLLVPTTYKIPPIVVELTDDNTTPETSGMIETGGNLLGVFFNIDCKGVSSNYRQCLNIRHQCEFGTDIDQLQFGAPSGAFPNGAPIGVDYIIGQDDIDEGGGRWFRDVFYELNRIPNQNTFTFTTFTTDFNTSVPNAATYSFSNNSANGVDYASFRGYPSGSEAAYTQPKHSYFFYFGLTPGKGALEKMNERFFTRCLPVTEKEFNILITTQPATTPTSNGSITFNVVAGTAPFTYTISGPNGYNNTGTISAPPAPQSVTVSNTPVGAYTIQVIDANGNIVTQNTNISGPPALYATANVTKLCSTLTSQDGEITITGIGGGTGSWTYRLYKSNGALILGPTTITTAPLIIGALAADTGSDGQNPPNIGYKLVITDTANATVTIYNLKVDGPTPVVLSVQGPVTGTTCWESADGAFTINIQGGQPPYSATTTGPAGYTPVNVTSINDAIKGQYTVAVVDNYGTPATLSVNVPAINAQMIAQTASQAQLNYQCDPNNYIVPFFITQGAAPGPISVQYTIDDAVDANNNIIWNNTTVNYVNASTPMYVQFAKPSGGLNFGTKIRMRSADGQCFSNAVSVSKDAIRLPAVTLSINVTGINNAKQCNPNVVSFKFNVSHLQANDTNRLPYTFAFKVNNGPTNTVQITSNQQLITASMPSVSSSAVITYTITDNVGCTATGTLPTIAMPTLALTASWTYNTNVQPNTKSLSISGGFAPYSTSPSVNSAKSVIQSVTVTDNVGCTFVTPFST